MDLAYRCLAIYHMLWTDSTLTAPPQYFVVVYLHCGVSSQCWRLPVLLGMNLQWDSAASLWWRTHHVEQRPYSMLWGPGNKKKAKEKNRFTKLKEFKVNASRMQVSAFLLYSCFFLSVSTQCVCVFLSHSQKNNKTKN